MSEAGPQPPADATAEDASPSQGDIFFDAEEKKPEAPVPTEGSIATHEPRVSDSEASVSEQGNGSGSGDETCLSANEETVDSVDAGHVTSPCDVQAPPCNTQAEEVAHHEQEKASTHLEEHLTQESSLVSLENVTSCSGNDEGKMNPENIDHLTSLSIIDDLKKKVLDLTDERSTLQRQLDDAKSEIYVAGCVRESLIELERQNASRIDEVATLQHLLQESTQEATSTRTRFEHECARLQATIDQLEHENKELRIQLKTNEKSNGSNLDGSSVGGGLLMDKDSLLAFSDVTKSFARKVKSNFQQSVMMPQSSPSHQPTSPVAPVNNVDESMQKAFEDTELLKSIVLPLEEQIQALKDKLRQTDSLLREHESNQAHSLMKVEILAKWLNGKTTDEASECLIEHSDSSPKQDVYIGLLLTRLALLTTELEGRRREHANVLQELDKCRKKVADFKRQSSSANSDLLRCKQFHLSELAKITSILTANQKLELASNHDPTDPYSEVAQPTGDVVVDSQVWADIQNELSNMKSQLDSNARGGSLNTEELTQLKSQLNNAVKEKDELQANVNKLRDDIMKQSSARKEIEQTWNEKAESHKSETQSLNDRVRELEGTVQLLNHKYTKFCNDARRELGKLIQYREKIVDELKRLQCENEKLVGLYDSKSIDMQNELIDLPSKQEDMHLLLLSYREELIHAKIAKEHIQENLQGEVSFLKSQIKIEQDSRDTLEGELNHEINSLRTKVSGLESCKSELEAQEKRLREHLENEAKNRQSQANLQRQLDVLEIERKQSDAKIYELKNKISTLQQELDNSVAVSNDFVRLSQSLQMELEKIRSQATEVRWQHEDDVEECNNCKHFFHGSRRKKGHCRHCGKIFCSDCLAKTVASGPHQRPSRVCDVCHTLLVQHSAPYFSTEAPHIND